MPNQGIRRALAARAIVREDLVCGRQPLKHLDVEAQCSRKPERRQREVISGRRAAILELWNYRGETSLLRDRISLFPRKRRGGIAASDARDREQRVSRDRVC